MCANEERERERERESERERDKERERERESTHVYHLITVTKNYYPPQWLECSKFYHYSLFIPRLSMFSRQNYYMIYFGSHTMQDQFTLYYASLHNREPDMFAFNI